MGIVDSRTSTQSTKAISELILPLFIGYRTSDYSPSVSTDSSPDQEIRPGSSSQRSIVSETSKHTVTVNDPLNNISDITFRSSANLDGTYSLDHPRQQNVTGTTSVPVVFPTEFRYGGTNPNATVPTKETEVLPPSVADTSSANNKLPSLIITGVTSIITDNNDTAADILRRGHYAFNLVLSVLRLGCFDITTNRLVTSFTLDMENSTNIPLRSLIGCPNHRLIILPTTAPPANLSYRRSGSPKLLFTTPTINRFQESASETNSTTTTVSATGGSITGSTNPPNDEGSVTPNRTINPVHKVVHFTTPSGNTSNSAPSSANTSMVNSLTPYLEPSPYPVATLFPDQRNYGALNSSNLSMVSPVTIATPSASSVTSASSVQPVVSTPSIYPPTVFSPLLTPYTSTSVGPYKASTPMVYSPAMVNPTMDMWNLFSPSPVVNPFVAATTANPYRSWNNYASSVTKKNENSTVTNISHRIPSVSASSSAVSSNYGYPVTPFHSPVPFLPFEYSTGTSSTGTTSEVTKVDNTNYVKSLISRFAFNLVNLRYQALTMGENGPNAMIERTCYLAPLDWSNPMMRDLSTVLSQMVQISYNAQEAQASKSYVTELSSIATDDFETVRTVLFESGAVPLLLQAIRYLNPSDRMGRQALEDAIQIICNIGYNHAAQTAMASPSLHMMDILFSRMRLDIFNSEICLKVARCVTVLTYQNSGCQLQAVHNGGIEVTLSALEKHNSHPFAVRKLLQLLESLLPCSDTGERLVRSKGMDILTNIRNHGWFRKSFRDDKLLRQAIMEIENTIFDAMNRAALNSASSSSSASTN